MTVVGLLLAMLVTGILFMAMAGGVHGATHECDLWQQTATGVEWICTDGAA
jgi:hypothetical protein